MDPAMFVVLDNVVYFQLAPVGLIVLGGVLIWLLSKSVMFEYEKSEG